MTRAACGRQPAEKKTSGRDEQARHTTTSAIETRNPSCGLRVGERAARRDCGRTIAASGESNDSRTHTSNVVVVVVVVAAAAAAAVIVVLVVVVAKALKETATNGTRGEHNAPPPSLLPLSQRPTATTTTRPLFNQTRWDESLSIATVAPPIARAHTLLTTRIKTKKAAETLLAARCAFTRRRQLHVSARRERSTLAAMPRRAETATTKATAAAARRRTPTE